MTCSGSFPPQSVSDRVGIAGLRCYIANVADGGNRFTIPVLSHALTRIARFFEMVGLFAVFFGRLLRVSIRRPYRFRLFIEQFERIGLQSIGIIALSSLAIGMIFTLQIVLLMAAFQAEIMVGAAVGMTLARELAPVITALMLIAKNGSAMTAEIGTMRVTEQIDAMETMSVDPIHYLVVPRVAASVLSPFPCSPRWPTSSALPGVMSLPYICAASTRAGFSTSCTVW